MHEWIIYADTFAHGRTTLDINPLGAATCDVISIDSNFKERWKARIHEFRNSIFMGKKTNRRSDNSAAVVLESLGLVSPTRLHERIIYAHGRTSLDPLDMAAREVTSLGTMLGKYRKREFMNYIIRSL